MYLFSKYIRKCNCNPIFSRKSRLDFFHQFVLPVFNKIKHTESHGTEFQVWQKVRVGFSQGCQVFTTKIPLTATQT